MSEAKQKRTEVDVIRWWENQGFYIVRGGEDVGGDCYQFSLGLYWTEESLKNGITEHSNFELYNTLERLLKDTKENRTLLESMVEGAFPGATIVDVESYTHRQYGGNYLQGIKVELPGA